MAKVTFNRSRRILLDGVEIGRFEGRGGDPVYILFDDNRCHCETGACAPAAGCQQNKGWTRMEAVGRIKRGPRKLSRAKEFVREMFARFGTVEGIFEAQKSGALYERPAVAQGV